MSLTLLKNKKLLLYFAFGMAGFLLALRASAWDNIIFQTETGGVPSILDAGIPQLYSATRNVAAHWIPTADTRVCGVNLQVELYKCPSGGFFINPYCFTAAVIRTYHGTEPPNAFRSPTLRLFHDSGFYNIPSSASQQFPSWVNFELQTCFLASASHDYWFELALNQGGAASGSYLVWGTGKMKAGIEYWQEDNPPKWYNVGTWWLQHSQELNIRITNDQTGGENPASTSYYQPPNPSQYNFVNKDFGLLGNMFRDVIVWTFYPDPVNLNRFGNLWDTIRLKPPIGYFTAARAELGNVGIGTPDIAFDTTAAADIISPLRTGIIVILWVMFAFWIFHRLRKLEL